ncbi:alpha/beta hydrolase [Streptomyces sp. NPDC002851]
MTDRRMPWPRLRRTALAALIAAAIVVPLSGAVRPAVPAPEPVRLAASAGLAERYAAHRANAAQAARLAERAGVTGRAATLRAMARPTRRFLEFDARGAGRTAEVWGDLRRAERIAVLVPGSDTGLDTYARFRRGAQALYDQSLHDRAGPRLAVVAWLGYETPGTVAPETLTTGRAEDAAVQLTRFVGALPGAQPVALLCHSYGSVVCGRAAPGLGGRVQDIAVYGSPGTGVDHARDLRTRARVWAGRGAGDWIGDVPFTRLELFGTTVGFGADPVGAGFGARVFPAGDGGHSDYLEPGSVALHSLARIALGSVPQEAAHA